MPPLPRTSASLGATIDEERLRGNPLRGWRGKELNEGHAVTGLTQAVSHAGLRGTRHRFGCLFAVIERRIDGARRDGVHGHTSLPDGVGLDRAQRRSRSWLQLSPERGDSPIGHAWASASAARKGNTAGGIPRRAGRGLGQSGEEAHAGTRNIRLGVIYYKRGQLHRVKGSPGLTSTRELLCFVEAPSANKKGWRGLLSTLGATLPPRQPGPHPPYQWAGAPG